MTKALDLDLKKLEARAFDRAEWAAGVLRRYHAATPKLDGAAARQLRALYDWMFVPPTLWPFNVQDVLEDCLAALEKGKRLRPRKFLGLHIMVDLKQEGRTEGLPFPRDEHHYQQMGLF